MNIPFRVAAGSHAFPTHSMEMQSSQCITADTQAGSDNALPGSQECALGASARPAEELLHVRKRGASAPGAKE